MFTVKVCLSHPEYMLVTESKKALNNAIAKLSHIEDLGLVVSRNIRFSIGGSGPKCSPNNFYRTDGRTGFVQIQSFLYIVVVNLSYFSTAFALVYSLDNCLNATTVQTIPLPCDHLLDPGPPVENPLR